MLRVFIIENDEMYRCHIRDILNYIVLEYKLNIKIEVCTNKIKEFITFFNNIKGGVYILDVDLGEDIHGLELASFIKKYDNEAKIIFFTKYKEVRYLINDYRIPISSVIEKEDLEKSDRQLVLAIKDIYDKRKMEENKMTFSYEDEVVEFYKHEVMYVEINENEQRLTLHTTNGKKVLKYLNKIKEILVHIGFECCKKNVYINRDNINKKERFRCLVKMNNNEYCNISFRYWMKI